MNGQNLKRILVEQREEVEFLLRNETVVERELSIAPALAHPNAVVIMGPRRAGKSFLALLSVRDKPYGYVNFDDERLDPEKTSLNDILRAVYEISGDVDRLVFDEIQNAPGWEVFVSRLRRTKKVVVTGSNSRLLSRDIATSLTGRHMDFTLFPFSFREYLRRKGRRLPPPKVFTTVQEAEIRRDLDEYLRDGGFPEVFKFGRTILKTLFEDVLQKDIVQRYKIRKTRPFRDLARLLSSHSGREFTFSRLRNAVSIRDVHTVSKFVDYLVSGYLFLVLERFSYKLKEQLLSPRKIYGLDTGMLAATAFLVSEDRGRVMENIVAVELARRRHYRGEGEVFYWKSPRGVEVDFVVKRGPKVAELIQVCHSFEEIGTRDRELEALAEASEELRCDARLVVSDSLEGEETYRGQKFRFLPLWRWLLD
jgi:predicted AAA+ superfamily ATPase